MMTTYKISFYPGIVLPAPYFVTVEAPTTDYQSLIDMLIDKLTEEGADGLFDDDETLNDDEIVIGGNLCRRLITGGMLNISEIDFDDIKYILTEKVCSDYPTGTFNIGFGDGDETQFDVKNANELTECWVEFCKENDISVVDVDYVERA